MSVPAKPEATDIRLTPRAAFRRRYATVDGTLDHCGKGYLDLDDLARLGDLPQTDPQQKDDYLRMLRARLDTARVS